MIKPEAVPDQTPALTRSRLGLIIILGALSAFGPLSLDMYLPGLPSLTKDLGGADWQVQLTLTTCLVGLAAGQLIAGPISDALGRRRPLLIGLVGYTVASLLCAFAPSVPVLIGFRLVQGLAGAAGIVIARAMVRDLYTGDEAARFFALTFAVNGLAPILAPVIGGQLLYFTNWRGIFVVLTLIGLALVIAAIFGLKETLPVERRHTGGLSTMLDAFPVLFRDRRFLRYSLTVGFAFAAMFAYIAGSPFVLENIYGVSPQLFSLIFAINALGLVSTSQISGRLIGRVKPERLLTIGVTGSLLGGWLLVVAVTLNWGLPGMLPAFFLIVASIGFIAPNATSLAMVKHAGIAGSASGLIGVMQYLIGGAVTPLVGIGGGTTWLLAIIIAFLSTTAFLIYITLARSPVTGQSA